MNISPINFNNSFKAGFCSAPKQNYNSAPKMQQQLTRDTVSFTGGVPYGVGLAINKESEKVLKDFMNMLKHELKPLIETRLNPNGPIAAGQRGIKGRVKAPYNTLVKAENRNKSKKNEIRNIGDIIAMRIVLRDSSQKSFDDIFKVFGKLVKQGRLNITEVESYRPTPKKSYVSQKTLDKFEDTCINAGLRPRIVSEPKPSGYPAVHLNIKLPNGQIAEIQIMGIDVEAFKEVEDLFYKRFCDTPKPLEKKYKVIEKILDENISKMTEFQKETMRNYIMDGYNYAKEIPPSATHPDYDVNRFLPYPYSLPQELNFASLYRMKEAADFVAKLN